MNAQMKEKRTFGEYLSLRRLKANLTIRELSSRSGLSATLICNLELNNYAPRLPTLEKLAFVFGEGVPMFLRRFYSSQRSPKKKEEQA